MQQTDTANCRRTLLWIAALGAILACLGLWFIAGWSFFAALVTGALFGAIAGWLLIWAFCTGTTGASVPAAPAPAPAPTPVPPAPRPAPTPAVAPSAPPPPAPEPQAAPQTATPPAFASMTATGAPRSEAPAAPQPPVAEPAPAAEPAPEPAPAHKRKASALETAMERSREPGPEKTELLTAPRGGSADDLKLIKGVGPKLEAMLNDIGIWHFDQIAAWKARDIAFVDSRLHGFNGRITRDGWVAQARELMQATAKAGGRTEAAAKPAGKSARISGDKA